MPENRPQSIDVDEEEEDVGEVVITHSDPLPADGAATSKLRRTQAMRPPQVGSPVVDLTTNEEQEEDEIEDASSPEKPGPPKPGFVQSKIDIYERKGQPVPSTRTPLDLKPTGGAPSSITHPLVDLTKLASGSGSGGLKNGMRSKVNGAQMQKPAVLAQKPVAPRPDSKKSPDPLPVDVWYFGQKMLEDYNLTYTTGGKLLLRAAQAPYHKLEIDLRADAASVEYGDPNDAKTQQIFFLRLEPPQSKKPTKLGGVYSKYFQQGRPTGVISVSLANADPAEYKGLVGCLAKFINEKSALRTGAVDALWEDAVNASHMQDTRDRRESGASSIAGVSRASSTKTAQSSDDEIDAFRHRTEPTTVKSKMKGKASAEKAIVDLEPEDDSPPRAPPRVSTRATRSTATYGRRGQSEAASDSRRQSVAPVLADQDEVILVYPPGQTGAVNITNGDLARLDPGQFLNDTLIEFGLKHVPLFLDLEKNQPELAKQIHVFSSFFYKKMNKKSFQEGYNSVAKWTAKFDLFEKKYIIVPINENLHWYLAIIYQPGNLLKPSMPSASTPGTSAPSTRSKARQEAEKSPELEDVSLPPVARPPNSKASDNVQPVDEDTAADGASPSSSSDSEKVTAQLLGSCSIEDDEVGETKTLSDGEDAADDKDSLFDDMEVDGAEKEKTEDADVEMDEQLNQDAPAPLNLPAPEPEPPRKPDFYGKRKGKRKATSPPPPPSPPGPVEEEAAEEEDEDEVEVVSDQPLTYVFTLDSLGGKHRRVHTVLDAYLKYEARAKKQQSTDDVLGQTEYKIALVPSQPNFCDCGLYLLHFAKTFASAPEKFSELIITKKAGNKAYPATQRAADWNAAATGTLRDELKARIEDLSVEWKKEKALREQEKKISESESSDSDVVMVNTTPTKKERSPKKTKMARMR
ncbi:ULP-PROTEASE domain-containing protein [Mycena kentingensis (nom. inval.)]|nr:ULP-PROTEASE domain-containing protein [Mycena kentingensis (nom. inval.)]